MQDYIDVFVDDFICLVQGNEPNRCAQRILLHAIDQVFCPLNLAENKLCQEPISVKKNRKGDCTWFTIRLILC